MQVARRMGKDRAMKLDPFLVAGSFLTTGIASVNRGYSMEFMLAISAGTFVALMHSLWKSRQRKADGVDTSYWAMIAIIGSSASAFFFAPSMVERTIPVVGVTLTLESAAFLISLAALPFIEWVLTGEALKIFKTLISKWVGAKT